MPDTPSIGGHAIHLVTPQSLAVAYDIVSVTGDAPNRACWAALGVCYQGGPLKITQQLKAHRYDVLSYGGGVLDELVDQGHDANEITTAGLAALQLLVAMLPGPGEAEAAEDFSGASDASTSP